MRKIGSDTINLSLIFKPKLHYDDIEYYLKRSGEVQIENDEIYALLEELTDLAYPTKEDEYDKRWEYFYVPIKKGRKTVAIPMWIMEYKEEFFAIIRPLGNFRIKKGNIDTEKFYNNVFTETLRLVPIIKKDESIIQKIVPYDSRTGKIKGCYVLEELLPKSERNDMLESYNKHISSGLQIKETSLNEYLNVASICYNGAYKEESKNLSPVELYKKRADGRDGGMLSIKDWNSKEEFSEWYHGGYSGHPFEIVFSWHRHGIHLYPPHDSSPFYDIRVTNYTYARDFLEMIKAMIEMKVPFEAKNMGEVLNFLTGDTYFTVNNFGEHDLIYIPSREYKQKYFYNIEWDDIKCVKWKA